MSVLTIRGTRLRPQDEPDWEYVRLPGRRIWHVARVYLEGIVVFACVGYREHSYPEDGTAKLPKGAKFCRRCEVSTDNWTARDFLTDGSRP